MYNKHAELTEIRFDVGTAESVLVLSKNMSNLTSAISDAVREMEKLNLLMIDQAQGTWLDAMNAISAVCTVIQTMIALTEAQVMAKLASKAEDITIIALYTVDYIKAFGAMIGKLAASVAAWVAQTGAKLADKAVDLQIIALYAADYVKAFGAMIAQIAASTAAWVKNTAAKVASTAAEWAQIAATTAWNALCAVATTVTTAFGAAMAFLTSPIGLVVVAITALIAVIVLLVKNWDTVKTKAEEVWTAVQNKFMEFSAFMQNIFAADFTEQFGAFGHVLNAFFTNVENAWTAVKMIFNGIINFIGGVFSGNWKKVWNGIVELFFGIWNGIAACAKAPINTVIGFINVLVSSVTWAINKLIGMLNALSFTIPDWVPVLGGESFGFQLSTVKTPQIPYLAQGAVLPANKPFLAVVGDQKRGTNIEAPLATIQEAVAAVMDTQVDAMLAGFEALLRENRQLRAVVESIEVGDTVIGQAAARYDRRRALARGGVL